MKEETALISLHLNMESHLEQESVAYSRGQVFSKTNWRIPTQSHSSEQRFRILNPILIVPLVAGMAVPMVARMAVTMVARTAVMKAAGMAS